MPHDQPTGELFRIATEQELLTMYGDREDVEWRKSHINADEELAALAVIYHGRGDIAAADACIEKIKDWQQRLTTNLILYECVQEL